MSDAKKIIEIILSDEKLKNSRSFQSAVYRDEPIIKTAAKMSSYVPPEIDDLYKSSHSPDSYSKSTQRLFYEQALSMKDYEDDFDYSGDFISYFPTYRSMNKKQLRGYFSWRTKVKRGIIKQTCLSFAFVYIYELLHLIGVDSPEAGFDALMSFWKAYGVIDPHINPYMKTWLNDFIVYYDLDKSLLKELSDADYDDALITLSQFGSRSDDDIFEAIKVLSSYRIENSKLYKHYPEDVKKVVCAVYGKMSEYYEKRRKKSFFESTFGNLVSCQYQMFGSAVFYDFKRYSDYEYIISDIHKYRCRNGKWSCEKFFGVSGRNRKLGDLIKTIDCLMRRKYDFTPSINQKIETKITVGIIEKEIDALLEEKRKSTAPEIKIDVSKLSGIRQAADITRDKLITESETDEEAVFADIPEKDTREETISAPNDTPLDDNEYELMRCLLYGESLQKLSGRKGIMLSVLADSINEKLFDMFGDTVIVFDGSSPELIEDYAEELKGIIKK